MPPFVSKSQARAAFGGYLGPEMKSKAKQWADETPSLSKLPQHAGSSTPKKKKKKKKRKPIQQ